MKVTNTKPNNEKRVKRKRGLGNVTYFSNFRIPTISLELLKMQTSNFACWWEVRDTKSKTKIGQKGAWTRSRNILFKFWDPLIYLERLKLQTSNFARGLKVRNRILNKKM